MRNLSQVIEYVYTNCLYSCPTDCTGIPIGKSLYMTIPLTGEHIEVPAFVAYALGEYTDMDAIAVTVNHTGDKGIYKSLSSNIRYALQKVYSPYHLVKITEEEEDYYATYGAIFNKDYKPVMLMTWEIDKIPVEEESLSCKYKYKMMRPVLRIAPEVFRKSNAVEKYIVNKIIPETLASEDIDWPNNLRRYNFVLHSYSDSPVIKAVIEDCPFSIRSADTPSVSTTNKDLLAIALNHLDELMQ